MKVIKRVLPILFAAVLLTVGLGSCDNDGCLDNGSALPLASFYGTGTTSTATVSSLSVYGLGAPGDSAIVSNTSTTQFYMPFRANATSTQYRLYYGADSIPADTLTFNYEVIPYFADVDCGAMYNFKITSFSYTANTLDSVAVIDSTITNENAVRILIFVPTD